MDHSVIMPHAPQSPRYLRNRQGARGLTVGASHSAGRTLASSSCALTPGAVWTPAVPWKKHIKQRPDCGHSPTGRLPGVTCLGELWGQRSWSEKDIAEFLGVRLSFLHTPDTQGHTCMYTQHACCPVHAHEHANTQAALLIRVHTHVRMRSVHTDTHGTWTRYTCTWTHGACTWIHTWHVHVDTRHVHVDAQRYAHGHTCT